MSSLLDMEEEQAKIESTFRLQSYVGRDKSPWGILIKLCDNIFKTVMQQATWQTPTISGIDEPDKGSPEMIKKHLKFIISFYHKARSDQWDFPVFGYLTESVVSLVG